MDLLLCSRQDQERKRQMELEKQFEKQRALEQEREEHRRKAWEQREVSGDTYWHEMVQINNLVQLQ